MRRLPLGSLQAFEAAARLKGIMAAASELHVTHGAVSKQVRSLERALGIPLFERRNRGIHLTRSGRWLAERLAANLGDLEQTIREFRARHGRSGPVTVSCEPTLCLRMLIPALSELTAHAGCEIRILAAGGPIDIRREPVDLAIRRS